MPYIPSEQLTDVNPNTSFLLQVDTDQRMNRIFGDSQAPIQYNVPDFTSNADPSQGLSQNQIFGISPNDTVLNKALDSPDPDVRQKAYDTIGQNNQALTAGVGSPVITPYYPWQDKYINDKFGYNPNLSQAQNEDLYYQDYLQRNPISRLATNITKFVGRVVPQAVLKLGEGFGYVGAMAIGALEKLSDVTGLTQSMGWDDTNFMKTVADNSMSRKLLQYEDQLKNSSLLSVYKPSDWDSKSFVDKLGNAALWNDQVADFASFLVSAAIPAGLIGKLGKGVSLLAGATELGEEGSYGLTNTAKYWNQGMRMLGTESLGDVGSIVYNTTSQSAMVAADGFKTYKQQLIDKRNSNAPGFSNLTDEQIDEKAGKVASLMFNTNLGILAVTNLFENKWFFKPIANKLAGVATDAGEQVGAQAYLDKATKLVEREESGSLYNKFMGRMEGAVSNPNARIPFYGSRFLKASLLEGLWGQNAQMATERWATQSPYINSEGDTIIPEKNFANQLLKQTLAAAGGHDQQTADAIGLGSLIGIISSGLIGKAFGGSDANGNFQFWKGARKTQVDNARASIVRYNNARENMLNVNDIFTTNDQGEKVPDEEKIKAKVDALRDYGFRQVTADDIYDDTFRAKLQKDLFAEYIASAVRANVHEGLITRLENLSSIPDDKLQALGFDPSSVFNNPEEYAQRGIDLIKKYQDIQATRTSKPDGMSFKDYQENEAGRKYSAYLAYAQSLSTSDAMDDYKGKMRDTEAEIKNGFSNLSATYPVHLTEINIYNTLQAEAKTIKETLNENDFFDYDLVNKQANKRLAEIETQKRQILSNIEALGDSDKITKIAIKDKDGKETGDFILGDKSINNQSHVDLNNSSIIYGSKFGQLSVDKATSDALYQGLTHPKDGIANYNKHLDYISRRKVAQEEADANPGPDVTASKLAVLEDRKENMEQVQKENPGAPFDFDQYNAINKQMNELTPEEKAAAAKGPDLEEREGQKPYAEIDGVRYFYPDMPNPKGMDPRKYKHIMQLFTVHVEQMAKDQIDEENKSVEQVADEKEASKETFENTPIIQGDKDNFHNTLIDNYENKALRHITEFGTANMESSDENTHTEILNPESYTQMLSTAINTPINLDMYQPILTKDREEWLNRFPEGKAEDVLKNNKLGMVLVFKKKGIDEYLTVGQHLPGKFDNYKNTVIVHSIENPKTDSGFRVGIDQRIILNSKKTNRKVSEVQKEFDETADTINSLRSKIKSGELIEQPVIIDYGGNGIIPTTERSATVNSRFENYNPQFSVVTAANIEQFPGSKEGQLVVTFPDRIADDSTAQHFNVFAPPISMLNEQKNASIEQKDVAGKIVRAVDDLINGNIKYDTYNDALNMIHIFLEKVVYTNNDFYFKPIKEGDKYGIEYIKLQDGVEKRVRALGSTRFNINNKAFQGQENIQIPLRDGTLEQVPTVVYKELVSNTMRTYRKVVKDGNDNLHLDPVNSYYNLRLPTVNIEKGQLIATPDQEEIVETPSSIEEDTPSESTDLDKAIEAAKKKLGKEKVVIPTNNYIIGNMNIDLDNQSFTYTGGIKDSVKESSLENFLEASSNLQKDDPNIIFGSVDAKKAKVYFFGNKESGIFVMFDDKLNQITNIDKFKDQNPEAYKEIENKCK